MRSAPLLLPTVAFAGAIALTRYCPWPMALMIVALVVIVIALAKRRGDIVIVSASFIIGMGAALLSAPQVITPGRYTLSGVVESESGSETSRHYILATPAGRVYLTTPSMSRAIAPGDSLTITDAWLEPPMSSVDLPDQHSVDNFYYTNRISAVTYVRREQMSVDGRSQSLWWRLRRLSRGMSHRILSSDINPDAARLLAATLLGDKEHLSESTRSTFSEIGIAHTLALSGMHAALIALMATILLWPLAASGHRGLMLCLTLGVLWLYAFMTGLSASVVRSVIMSSLFVGSYLLQRRHSPLNALSCACLMILIFTPRALFEVGFQLSFAAVAGILLWIEGFNRLNLRGTVPRFIANSIGVPTSAMLATGVISAYYFRQFPALFLLSNIPIALILPWFMGCGALWLLITVMGYEATWLETLIDWLYTAIDSIATWVASLPGASVGEIYFSPFAIGLWWIGLALVALYLSRARRAYIIGAGLSIVGATIIMIIPPRANTPEYFVTTQKQRLEIIVNDGAHATLYTNTPPRQIPSTLEECQRRYADYLGYRRIGALRVGHISDHTLTIGGERWLIIDHDSVRTSPEMRADYMIVCGGFKGDIVRLASEAPESRIVLSSTLNRRRHDRYAAELRDAGITPLSTRERALHLPVTAPGGRGMDSTSK